MRTSESAIAMGATTRKARLSRDLHTAARETSATHADTERTVIAMSRTGDKARHLVATCNDAYIVYDYDKQKRRRIRGIKGDGANGDAFIPLRHPQEFAESLLKVIAKCERYNGSLTPEKTDANPNEQDPVVEARVKCERCKWEIAKADARAIGKTFIIFYYCPECFEVVANEESTNAT